MRVVVQDVVEDFGGQENGGEKQPVNAKRINGEVDLADSGDLLQVEESGDKNGARTKRVARQSPEILDGGNRWRL